MKSEFIEQLLSKSFERLDESKKSSIIFDRVENLYWPSLKGYTIEEGFSSNVGSSDDGIHEVVYQNQDKGYIITFNLQGLLSDTPKNLKKSSVLFEVTYLGDKLDGKVSSFSEVESIVKKIDKWSKGVEKSFPKKVPSFKGLKTQIFKDFSVEYTKDVDGTDIKLYITIDDLGDIINGDSSDIYVRVESGYDYEGSFTEKEESYTIDNIKKLDNVIDKSKKLWNDCISKYIKNYESQDSSTTKSLISKLKKSIL